MPVRMDVPKPKLLLGGDGGDLIVTRIQSLNSLHTSDRTDRWYSVELLRGSFQAITTEEWNYPIVRST